MMQPILIVKLAKRTIADKVFKDKAYEIARISNYDGYQRALASMTYIFFDKKNRIRSDSDKQNGNKCKWTFSWRIT